MWNETQGNHEPVSYATIAGILYFFRFLYLHVLLLSPLSMHVAATPKEWSIAVRGLSLPSTPIRRTPRLQASGLFRCASVGGSQRTLCRQCVCDLCLAGSPTLGPCRHQGKSASVPAFNCFEITAFGGPPNCRILGLFSALALAAASARFDGSVIAAPAPKGSPITMEVSNSVARRYVEC